MVHLDGCDAGAIVWPTELTFELPPIFLSPGDYGKVLNPPASTGQLVDLDAERAKRRPC